MCDAFLDMARPDHALFGRLVKWLTERCGCLLTLFISMRLPPFVPGVLPISLRR